MSFYLSQKSKMSRLLFSPPIYFFYSYCSYRCNTTEKPVEGSERLSVTVRVVEFGTER